jgi:predicted Zn-dependent protease
MKTYLRLTILVAVSAAIVFAVYLVRQATVPQSVIIAKERNRLYSSRDKKRMAGDPVYAGDLDDKLALLDYWMAAAYNDENKPDKAIAILQRLINDEEAREKGGISRRSRSYMHEANYYEALKESFELKHEVAEVNKSLDRYTQLKIKAAELKRLESREDGKYVGSPAD